MLIMLDTHIGLRDLRRRLLLGEEERLWGITIGGSGETVRGGECRHAGELEL